MFHLPKSSITKLLANWLTKDKDKEREKER
jgi:hypothetical protein